MSDTQADLDDEAAADAGRPRLSLRSRLLIGAGLLALTAGASAWGLLLAGQDVRWQDVGFTVQSPTQAEATFDVFLYTDAQVTCHVTALNVRFAEVGATDVAVDPADGKAQRITATLVTTEEATTAVVDSCKESS